MRVEIVGTNKEIWITELKCSRCEHRWVPRHRRIARCPKCKTLLYENPPEVVKERPKTRII